MKILRKFLVSIFATLGILGANNLIKSGFYRSLGIGIGYYYYNEVNSRNNAFIMRIDSAMLNIAFNTGFISKSGLKYELYADANVAQYAKYTGHTRDENNPQNDGKPISAIDSNSYYRLNGIVGYNLLKASSNISLYAQSGLSYYLSRNDASSLERLQGYLRIPLQIEGEVGIDKNLVLNFMLGVKYIPFGHHLSTATRENASGNLNVIQRDGLFGASGFIGATYKNRGGTINSWRLHYEYMRAGDSPSSGDVRTWGGTAPIRYHEPKNSTHIITLQYFWSF